MDSGNPQLIHKESPLEFTTSLRRLILLSLGIFGGVAIVLGVGWDYINSQQKISTVSSDGVNGFHTGSVAGEVRVKIVKVDVSGAVISPGVYEIPYDSRIQDVLIAAGGMSTKADQTYVSKNINLAQRVSDGMKIYFPEKGEINIESPTTASVAKSTSINLNTATLAELDTLPGIGPVMANKIVAQRPYQTVSQLLERKVVSSSVYTKIKDSVTAP